MWKLVRFNNELNPYNPSKELTWFSLLINLRIIRNLKINKWYKYNKNSNVFNNIVNIYKNLILTVYIIKKNYL